jgi:hypothetical protein
MSDEWPGRPCRFAISDCQLDISAKAELFFKSAIGNRKYFQHHLVTHG